MNNRPSGTVTFLFTDIEGSTKLFNKNINSNPFKGWKRGAQNVSFLFTSVV